MAGLRRARRSLLELVRQLQHAPSIAMRSTICKPMGKPSAVEPQGVEIDGFSSAEINKQTFIHLM